MAHDGGAVSCEALEQVCLSCTVQQIFTQHQTLDTCLDQTTTSRVIVWQSKARAGSPVQGQWLHTEYVSPSATVSEAHCNTHVNAPGHHLEVQEETILAKGLLHVFMFVCMITGPITCRRVRCLESV